MRGFRKKTVHFRAACAILVLSNLLDSGRPWGEWTVYLLLFALWLVFNGRLTLELVLFGLALTAVFASVARLFGYGPRTELRLWRRAPLFAAFLAVLFWEIVRANLGMIGMIFGPERRIDPTVVRVRTDLKTQLASYLLANAITLTPGTLTVQSEDGVLTVHCIRPDLLEDTENGKIVRLLRRMEA